MAAVCMRSKYAGAAAVFVWDVWRKSVGVYLTENSTARANGFEGGVGCCLCDEVDLPRHRMQKCIQRRGG